MNVLPMQMPQARTAARAGQATKAHIAALDGLRFMAALFVAAAHYAAWTLEPGKATELLFSLSGLGMTLFFVLSGVVIHYNYGALLKEPGGLKQFAIARFSRLYPLYLLLFVIEFIVYFRWESGSCGLAGDFSGLFFALPYYLTMTQDWTYGVICKNSLNYQYGMMAQVSWSISAEVFFYLIYCFYGRWAIGKRAVTLFAVAGLVYLLLFAVIRECFVHREMIDYAALVAFGPVATEQNGYQDSFLRWIFYFSPFSQIVHFLAGVAIAQNLLTAPAANAKTGVGRGKWLVPVSAFILLGVHFYLYGVVAYHSGFVGRNASSFCGPLVVLAIYLIVKFPEAALSRFLSLRLMVGLGEASYSLYLLHAFLSVHLLQPPVFGLHGWALWAFCLVSLLCLSRLSYIAIERPARNLLRKLLSGRRGVSVPRFAASLPQPLTAEAYPAPMSRSAG